MEQCRAIPEFNNYLAYIFAHGHGLATEVRQSAGLLLKNNIRGPATFSESGVKEAIITGLRLSDRALRHTAGTCVVTLMASGSGGAGGTGGGSNNSSSNNNNNTSSRGVVVVDASSWPELPNALAQFLDSGDPSAIEGALDTVYKLYEEAVAVVEGETPPGSGQRPSDALLPRVLNHFHHPDAAIRALSVDVLNLAANYMPPALHHASARYLQGLFQLAQDPSPAVRKAVCLGLVQLTAMLPEKLEPHLNGIIEYMLASSQDGDESVAVEASEFWSTYPESGLDVGILRPYLPRLIPVLLKNMVFDEYDEEVAEAEADEEEVLSGRRALGVGVRERDADVKPSHLQHHHQQGVGEGEGEGEEEEDDDEDEVSRWNLRRSSAAGLDMLSSFFGDDMLPLLLPAVQSQLASSEWRAREAAILALGAVSDGCAGGLATHLPGIVAAVLPGLKDPRPMVRAISCWALTRYSKALLDRASATAGNANANEDRAMLDAVITQVCERVLDHNRKVQESACGSIAAFVEEAGNRRAAPYQGQILGALGAAIQRYGRRSLRCAYDSLCTVAGSFPSALQTAAGAGMVLPPLVAKVTALHDGDRDLLPLLECIATVAPAAGQQLQPYAPAVFGRCVALVDRTVAGAGSGAIDKDEADEFVEAALDAISGLVDGLGAGVESLVAQSVLVDVVVPCCRDHAPGVRQSAFALVGDLANKCIPHLRPALGEIIPAALANLEPAAVTEHSIYACNNAAWALGQLAVGCAPEEVGQFAIQTLERLNRVLAMPSGSLPKSFVENSAIAIGRVACKCPDLLAPHGEAFVGPLCAALRSIRDGLEKENAFLGLFAVLERNPQAGAGAFTSLCEAVVSWKSVTNEGLLGEMRRVMGGYKGQLVAIGQWETAMASLSPAAANKLVTMLNLV